MSKDILLCPASVTTFSTGPPHLILAPERVIRTDATLSAAIVSALEFGIQYHSTEVVKESLRAVGQLTTFLGKNAGTIAGPGTRFRRAESAKDLQSSTLQKFLGVIFNAIVYRDFRAEALDAYSNTLLALISCEKQAFQQMASAAASQQPTAERQQRLAAAFAALIGSNGLQLGLVHRANRRIFQARMFLEAVRGFVNSGRFFEWKALGR